MAETLNYRFFIRNEWNQSQSIVSNLCHLNSHINIVALSHAFEQIVLRTDQLQIIHQDVKKMIDWSFNTLHPREGEERIRTKTTNHNRVLFHQ